jgi:hypothetical protein
MDRGMLSLSPMATQLLRFLSAATIGASLFLASCSDSLNYWGEGSFSHVSGSVGSSMCTVLVRPTRDLSVMLQSGKLAHVFMVLEKDPGGPREFRVSDVKLSLRGDQAVDPHYGPDTCGENYDARASIEGTSLQIHLRLDCWNAGVHLYGTVNTSCTVGG